MVSVKERTVKGKRYIYVSSSASFKGERKRFEKCIGPSADRNPEMKRRIEFYSDLLEFKSTLYRIYLKAKGTRFTYLPSFYSFYLALIKQLYHDFLSDLYLSEIDRYEREFNIRYVHNTTGIEGNTLSLRETAMIMEDGIAPAGKHLREIHEVENYKRAFRFMKGSKGDISKDLILKLHDLIQRNIDHDSAGNLRRIGVNITGSEWQPTPAILIDAELDKLISWYRENQNNIPPFELASLFHIRFLQIHPFTDGNGRVGRELLNYTLARNDYPPIIIPIERREEYMDDLTLADEGDPLPLMEFLALQLIRDHANVVGSIKDRFTGDIKGIKPGEIQEMVGLMIWFFNLIGELDLRVPPHARSEIEKIHRQFLSDLAVDPDLIKVIQS